MDIFKFLGALGLVLISIGIIVKDRKKQDLYYIIGGVLLEIYSIYIGDVIFIILQIIFTLAGIYDYIKISKSRSTPEQTN